MTVKSPTSRSSASSSAAGSSPSSVFGNARADRFVPAALTIAGSDSGGGAGIQADLKTFSAHAVYGASAVTAITAQNTRAVARVQLVEPAMVAAQIETVLADIRIDAIKIGMLGSADIVEAVADALLRFEGPVVLDPVMIAKSGDPLLSNDAIDTIRRRLLPRATVVTPNIPEAAHLLGRASQARAITSARTARELLAGGARAVVLKGGHAPGDRCTDMLATAGSLEIIDVPRIDTANTHGTGCSLSAALAARLAMGDSLLCAWKNAHRWLQTAIRKADSLGIGHGHGPVHHFHGLWP